MDPFFGIDIASEQFVCFNYDQGIVTVQNNRRAIRSFLKSLPKHAILALEATGGYGTLLCDMACETGFRAYLLQPGKVKRFRQAGPLRGTTDRICAKQIREYIETFHSQLHPYQPLPPFEAKLRKLFRTRDGLVRKRGSLKLQLRSLGDAPKQIEKTLKGLSERVDVLTKEIERMLATAQDAKVLATIPSVKTCTIAAVLPVLRTIPFKDKYAFDSFAGMDLKPNESGKFRGKRRMSKEGDKLIRRALYLSALSAIRTPAWKDYYRMLVDDKKLNNVQAVNALARKIMHCIFGVYRTQTPFDATPRG